MFSHKRVLIVSSFVIPLLFSLPLVFLPDEWCNLDYINYAIFQNIMNGVIEVSKKHLDSVCVWFSFFFWVKG